ncbi:MAG TPA: DegT/DnrJ/EryC1/StrS family aminotransferase, partial [Oscillospiraceae bacterium]|nr:DegT/DnrJ/EryC1/StrS family aminotransferase [Oscillospiraceae bacterium]
TTSGGGMLVSNNGERIAKTRFWATQARDPAPHYQHSELGFNYRMSNVCAGIGRGQLKVLNDRIRQKRAIYDYYKKELEELPGLKMMPINDWNEPNCWLSCIYLTDKVRPGDILQALEAENIEARPIWKPMHIQPFYRDCDYFGTDVSEKIFENGLCLPSDTKMNEEDLRRVIRVIKSLW